MFHTHSTLATSSMEASLTKTSFCSGMSYFTCWSGTKVRNMSHLHFPFTCDMKTSCAHSHFTTIFLAEVLLTSLLDYWHSLLVVFNCFQYLAAHPFWFTYSTAARAIVWETKFAHFCLLNILQSLITAYRTTHKWLSRVYKCFVIWIFSHLSPSW